MSQYQGGPQDPNRPQQPQVPGQPYPPQHGGATTFAPPQPPKKRRVWLWVLIGILALFLIVIVACSAITVSAVNDVAKSVATATSPADPTESAAEPADEPSDQPTKAKPTKNALSGEQQDAVGAAKDYLEFTAFSKKGLIRQLSSDAGSGFSKKDATAAVESMDVDWKEQAVKAAKQYRDTIHFSRKGLIQQLESDAGSAFTHDQAVYGADHSR
jgi:hypothetical protein